MQRNKIEINKTQEKQAGITLVALVITVVVMLILAGVAIAAVVDGDGLFSKTREATEVYENATENEEDMVPSMMNEIDRYIENPSNPVLKEVAELGVILNENQTFDGRIKGTYNNPIIPKGFAPINENGADWGTEEGYKSGLVITDEVTDGESTGNEFVWVPVDGINVTFERQDWRNAEGELLTLPEDTIIGSNKTTEYTETVPIEIVNSITKNGGFYIARFEAGQSINGKPISKQGAIVYNNVNWNISKTSAEVMYAEEDISYGVVSTLIYGTQWDTTLKFIGAYEGDIGYATDSTGKGNYSGTNGGDTTIDTPATCGLLAAFREKNIYDMAGNVWEWTMEEYNSYRVRRGGNCNNSGLDGSASSRVNRSVEQSTFYGRFPCSTLCD